MPRCVKGNHWASVEGDTRCAACARTSAKQVSVPSRLTAPTRPLPRETATQRHRTNPEHTLPSVTEQYVAALAIEEHGDGEGFTAEELVTWWELTQLGNPPGHRGCHI